MNLRCSFRHLTQVAQTVRFSVQFGLIQLQGTAQRNTCERYALYLAINAGFAGTTMMAVGNWPGWENVRQIATTCCLTVRYLVVFAMKVNRILQRLDQSMSQVAPLLPSLQQSRKESPPSL